MTSKEAFLALNLLPKIGPVRVRHLLKRFQRPEVILGASSSQLQQVSGVGPEMAGQIQNWEDHIDLEEEKRRMADYEIEALTIDDEAYPPALREIHDPPFLL